MIPFFFFGGGGGGGKAVVKGLKQSRFSELTVSGGSTVLHT